MINTLEQLLNGVVGGILTQLNRLLPPFIVAMYQMPISTTMPSSGGRTARPTPASLS